MNHDSRVHNYWIHYMSLCILLKLSYMMCGSISLCEFKICLVTPLVISAIKIFLIFSDWLPLVLHVGVRSKFFVKITFERNISLFQDNNKTKNKAQLIENIWCIHDIWKNIVAKYNAHSMDNCILSMSCQHFASYWSLLKI